MWNDDLKFAQWPALTWILIWPNTIAIQNFAIVSHQKCDYNAKADPEPESCIPKVLVSEQPMCLIYSLSKSIWKGFVRVENNGFSLKRPTTQHSALISGSFCQGRSAPHPAPPLPLHHHPYPTTHSTPISMLNISSQQHTNVDGVMKYVYIPPKFSTYEGTKVPYYIYVATVLRQYMQKPK